MTKPVAISIVPLMLIAARLSVGAAGSCAISGVVIDVRTGRLLPRTEVLISLTGVESEIPVRHLTDTAGRFCFQNLTPGDYIVRAKRAGYLDATYGEQQAGGTGLPVAVAKVNRPVDLVLRMTRQAAISGVLLDRDGDPISPARIVLLKRAWDHGKVSANFVQEAETDDQGAFRFFGLLPGTYYLSGERGFPGYCPVTRAFVDAQGQPLKEQEVKTYYAGALSFPQATPIPVKSGEEVEGLTLVLRKVQARHITGRLSPDLLAQGVQQIFVVEHMDHAPGIYTGVSISKDGTFHVDGLVPTLYTAMACCSSGSQRLANQIDLTDGDAENVVLEPASLLTFVIHVRVEGENAKSAADVTLDDSHQNFGGETQPDGTVKFSDIPVGTYRIHISHSGNSLFLKRLWVDGEPQTARVLDLRTAHPAYIDTLWSSHVASTTGQVASEHELTNGVTIVLEEETGEGEPLITAADSKAAFKFGSLAPGEYRLYAFQGFDETAWGDPELKRAFRPKSVAITLQENERCRVTAPLISFSSAPF